MVNVSVQPQPPVSVTPVFVTPTVTVPEQLSVTEPTNKSASASVGRELLQGSEIGPAGQCAKTGALWSTFQLYVTEHTFTLPQESVAVIV